MNAPTPPPFVRRFEQLRARLRRTDSAARIGWIVVLLLVVGVFYVGLIARDVGGPALGASVSLAGAVVAAGASFVGRSG